MTSDRRPRYEEWFRLHERQGDSPLIPAATVVLLRDGADGIETLMMRKNTGQTFGGMWVFPGGKLEPEDYQGSPPDQPGDQMAAARRAAVRETAEEAGLDLDPDSLVRMAHWVPPPQAPKRYATWIFVARAPAGDVVVDGGEIREHGWWRPADVLDHDRQELELAPPTFVTLSDLAPHGSVAAATTFAAESEPGYYATKLVRLEGGAMALWEGDAGYQDGDVERSGRRNRLHMTPASWQLLRNI